MKTAIVATITGFLASAIMAAPVPQWVPSSPGGIALSSPIGGVSFGPGGFVANGLLGGISIGAPRPQPPPPGPQIGWGRAWNTDTSEDNAAAVDETA
jgi:hypothetical protein